MGSLIGQVFTSIATKACIRCHYQLSTCDYGRGRFATHHRGQLLTNVRIFKHNKRTPSPSLNSSLSKHNTCEIVDWCNYDNQLVSSQLGKWRSQPYFTTSRSIECPIRKGPAVDSQTSSHRTVCLRTSDQHVDSARAIRDRCRMESCFTRQRVPAPRTP